MFAGKTTELLRLSRRHALSGRNVLVIKHKGDLRYTPDTDSLVARDGATGDAVAADDTQLHALVECAEWAAASVVAIDEGQFYDDIVDTVTRALDAGKVVIVAALDGTFERKPFGHVLELVPLADSVTKLLAVCSRCGADAPFTKRRGSEREERIIGGPEKYMAVCRSCYLADD
jgi:thymidine kinase